MRTRQRLGTLTMTFALALALVGASCGGDDAADTTTTTDGSGGAVSTTTAVSSTEATAPVLTILVSNDDGVGAPGISAVVEALSVLPDTEVIVSAPAENQSGSGSKTTDGELEIMETETAAGYPATSVGGFPADAVNWALDGGVDTTPDLVVTGINAGQNLGAIGDQLSGTIGAARAAAARGIPALATSAALSDAVDYDLAATFVVDWVEANRAALIAGDMAGDTVVLQNLNVPVCTAGEIRGEVEVPMAAGNEGAIADQDCTSTLADPGDDITAFNNGFVALSDVSLEPAA